MLAIFIEAANLDIITPLNCFIYPILDIQRFIKTSVSSSKLFDPSQSYSSKVYEVYSYVAEAPLTQAHCPMCGDIFPLEYMNEHLDNVHFI